MCSNQTIMFYEGIFGLRCFNTIQPSEVIRSIKYLKVFFPLAWLHSHQLAHQPRTTRRKMLEFVLNISPMFGTIKIYHH